MYENPLNAPQYPPPPQAQPHAAYAAAYAPPQPYAPPAYNYDPVPVYEEQGSYGLGIALGILFGLIVLIIVMAVAKSETKRGALHGFLGKTAVVVLFVIAALAMS
jgi:hypothetical protein